MIPRMTMAADATRPRSGRRARARRWSLALVSAGATAGLAASMAVPATASLGPPIEGFRQVNLVSDQPGWLR